MKRAASTWVRQEDVERLPECFPPPRCSQKPSDTMNRMKKWFLLLLPALSLSAVAVAQEFSEDLYQFVLDTLRAEDGKYDEALSRIDKVLARHPVTPVPQF